MKKSNSKKLYRFVHQQKSKENISIAEDSFDSLSKTVFNPLLATSSSSFIGTKPTILLASQKPTHNRSQTYPVPSPLSQTSSSNKPESAKQMSHKYSNSQSSMGNETVIIKEEPQQRDLLIKTAPQNWSEAKKLKGKDLTGELARMRVNHQIRKYQIQESVAQVQKQRQFLAIKERILTSLLGQCKQQFSHIEFA